MASVLRWPTLRSRARCGLASEPHCCGDSCDQEYQSHDSSDEALRDRVELIDVGDCMAERIRQDRPGGLHRGGRRHAVRVEGELGQILTLHTVLDADFTVVGILGVLDRHDHGLIARVHHDLLLNTVGIRVDERARVDELVLAGFHRRERERVRDLAAARCQALLHR